MSISEADPLLRMGKVSFGGVLKEVSLAYVPEAKVDDYVIVHVGFALSKVDEDEAQKVFEYLKRMGELGELKEGAPAGRCSCGEAKSAAAMLPLPLPGPGRDAEAGGLPYRRPGEGKAAAGLP